MQENTNSKLRVRISLVFTIVSIALWLYSLSQSKLVIGHFGLIHSLTPTFFLAFVTLLISFCIALSLWKKCTILLLLQSVLLVAFLWLTPPIIGGSQPVLAHVYSFWGDVDYLLSHGYLNEAACWYHAWPSSWLMYATFTLLTGITSADAIITMMPFIWQLLYLPPLYLLMTRMSDEKKKNYVWAGIWLFFLGNWVGQSYLSPQSHGYLIYLILLYFFVIRMTKNQDYKYLVLCILLFVGLTATHIITSLITWSIALAFYIRRGSSKILPLSFTAILVIWNVYFSVITLPKWGPQLFTGILDIERLLATSLFERFQGSASRLDVVSVRLATTLLVLSVGLVGYLLSFMTEKRRVMHMRVLKTLASTTLLTLVIGAGIGFEIPYRIYFFILPLVAYFGSKLLKFKFMATVLVILLTVLFPLSIISQYGNQLVDHQSQMDITAVNFFHNMVERGVVAGATPSWLGEFSSARPFGMFRNVENYHLLRYEDIIWKEGIAYSYARPLPPPRFGNALYIPFGVRDRNLYDFLYNDTQSYYEIDHILKSSKNINLVYNNGDMNLYASENWS